MGFTFRSHKRVGQINLGSPKTMRRRSIIWGAISCKLYNNKQRAAPSIKTSIFTQGVTCGKTKVLDAVQRITGLSEVSAYLRRCGCPASAGKIAYDDVRHDALRPVSMCINLETVAQSACRIEDTRGDRDVSQFLGRLACRFDKAISGRPLCEEPGPKAAQGMPSDLDVRDLCTYLWLVGNGRTVVSLLNKGKTFAASMNAFLVKSRSSPWPV